MRDLILFLITFASSTYAVICHFRVKVYRDGFSRIAKIAFNPQTEEDCIRIVEKLKDDAFGTENSNNK